MADNLFPPAPELPPVRKATEDEQRRMFSDGSIWIVLQPLIQDDDAGVNIVPSYRVKSFADRLHTTDEEKLHAFARTQLELICEDHPEWPLGQWFDLDVRLSGWYDVLLRIQCVRQEPRSLFIN